MWIFLASSIASGLAVEVCSEESFNYLAIGDWGDDKRWQRACAAGMATVAAEINAKQVFVLGDNFYPSGIAGDDSAATAARFKRTFEDVYSAPSLARIPFIAIAGNHDHAGNVSAQIAYTNHEQNKHGRWQFPHYWHNTTQVFEVQGRRVELETLLFDSVVMCGSSVRGKVFLGQDGQVSDEPADMEPAPDSPLAVAQLAWLEERMRTSTADYLCAAAVSFNMWCWRESSALISLDCASPSIALV